MNRWFKRQWSESQWLKASCIAAACGAIGVAIIPPGNGSMQSVNAAELAATGSTSTAGGIARSTPASAVTDNDVIAYIDEMIRKGWADAGVKPSVKATDGEWVRRVFLDVNAVSETGALYGTARRADFYSAGISFVLTK